MRILKFGGTSVATAARRAAVARIVGRAFADPGAVALVHEALVARSYRGVARAPSG